MSSIRTNDARRARRRAQVIAVIIGTLGALVFSASASHAAFATGTAAKTGDTGNGKIDSVTVTFNTPMSDSTPKVSSGPGSPGFRVEGYQIWEFDWVDTTHLKIHLVEGDEPDGDATPRVIYESDGGGATAPALGESESFDLVATDGAGPVLLSVHVNDQGGAGLFGTARSASGLVTVPGDTAILTFSEPAALAGGTATARWGNLEKAIKFNNEGACPADGIGTIDTFNVPQPDLQSPNPGDAISQPVDDEELTSTFVIEMVPGTLRSTPAMFPGGPVGCWLGIDPTLNYNSTITDAAGNAAIRQITAEPVIKAYPTHVDASLLWAETRDEVGDPDGVIDTVRLVFDQVVHEETLDHLASRLTVSLGPTFATVTGVDEDPAPNAVLARFTLPAAVTWDTGVQPTAGYTRPQGCTSSTATDHFKTYTKTPGFLACVDSFSESEPHDRAAPLAVKAVTTDQDGNGRLDRVTVTFSEELTHGHPAGWTLNDQPATDFQLLTNARKAVIPFDEGDVGDTGSTATISYTQQGAQQTRDAWENQVLTTGLDATDAAAPRIDTATVLDTNADGSIDRVLLKYSEPIVEPAASLAKKFSVGGVQATGFAAGEGDVANDDLLTLAVNVPGTAAQDVVFSGGTISDAAGNAGGDQTIDALDVIDQAAPQATVTVSPAAPIGIETATITVTYSEEMETSVAPVVTLAGKAVTPLATEHENGFRTDDPTVWEGSVELTAGDCGEPTGCAVEALAVDGVDLRGVAQDTASFATEIDTIAPADPTLGTFGATVPDGESVPALTVNMFTTAISLPVDLIEGDAAGGTAELLLDGEPVAGTQESIGASATSVTLSRSYADLAELQEELGEGVHAFGVRLCDDAGNCADSSASADVTVDTTPVDATLIEPAGDDVVAGGDVRTITWDVDETATDFDRVLLESSFDNGASYATIVDGQAADDTYEWTMPEVDVANALVRAASVDTAGNKAYGTSQAFTIDSSPPVVTVTGPSADFPFVPAGDTATITWDVEDASVHRATDPITVEYSTNNGRSWQEINGGSYSHADDGAEAWSVPAGTDLRLRVRVTATDATDKVSQPVSSPRLIGGLEGYVAASKGTVVPFGTAPGGVDERKKKGDWVRGMALAPNGKNGYTVNGRGVLYPFAVDGASKAKKRKLGLPKDSVRGVVLRSKWKGYVVDAQGHIHRFGRTPRAHESKTWRRCDCARGIVLNSDRTGGYVLSAYGKVFPFSLGKQDMPKKIRMSNLFGKKKARDFVLNSNDRSGYILKKNGKVYPFGGARNRGSSDVSRRADAQALVRLQNNAGYWVGPDGVLHPYGKAFGDPTRKRFGRWPVRAASSTS